LAGSHDEAWQTGCHTRIFIGTTKTILGVGDQ